jgi:membrane-associated phospholipid phosphatase
MSHLLAAWWSDIVHALVAASNGVYVAFNSIAGRFWLIDNLISLPLYNQLVKAALLSGCFLAVWHARQDEDVVRRNRRILLVTLLASVFVVAATKTISSSIVMPRPFVQSVPAFHLEGNRLIESRPLPYRVPLDTKNQARYRQLLSGEVPSNDLDAFPSDHAAFYVAIAAGIFMASGAIGSIAVAWTLFAVLASRVITGQHSPLDVAAGAGIGFGILVLFQYLFDRWLRRLIDPVVGWTLRHQALASVLIFIALFEVANTLQDLGSLIETGHAIAHYL